MSLATTRSEALFTRLDGLMPAACTRTTTHYAPFPIAIASGAGARIEDVDGNAYIDVLNNYTALVHGHAHPTIVAAIERRARAGWSFPSPTTDQAELATRIRARFPSIERLRFTNSGTEAVMVAVRVARAFTGRSTIVKAIGGYHGGWEQVAAGAGEDVPGGEAPPEPGIPAAVRDLVVQVPYDDEAALAAVMAEHGDDVAAILLEPLLGHVVEPASAAYLAAAQRIAHAHGALLLLDEVISARLHEGGAQALHGLRPDLTTLGKIIGGGLPVGAFGGREDVMAVLDPRRTGGVEHHGTFNGNGITMAAGCASLDLLPQAEIDRIDALGARLASGLERGLADAGLPGRISRLGSIMHVHVAGEDRSPLFWASLAEGLYMAPRGQVSISTAMDEGIVDEAAAAFGRAAKVIAGGAR